MTNDLDRALIAMRVSRDHGHGAVLNDAEVPALLAEIDRLRERQSSADMCLDAVHEARRVLREHFGGNFAFLDDDLVHGVVKMKEEIDRLTHEHDEARAERDALRGVLMRHGFVPCDIPACNCGSWHPRFGYPERMREIGDALAAAGHPLSNENGNKPLNALRELIAERDALAKQAEPFRRLVDACKLLSSEAEEYEFDDGIGRGAMLDYWHEFDRKLDAALAQIEELRRQLDPSGEYASADDLIAALRAEAAEDEATRRDAERYRFLACKGVPPHSHRCSRWRLEYWNGEWWDPLMKEELDAAIDAQIEKEKANGSR